MVYVIHEERESESSDSFNEKKPRIAIRWVIVTVVFINLTVVIFARNSLSVAIVAMVNSTSSDSDLDSNDVCPAAVNKSEDYLDSDTPNGEFYWTNSEQGLVIGAYFWGYLISRLLLSRPSEKLGSRESMTIGLVSTGILSLLSPLCAEVSPYLLMVNRFLVGASYGTSPAICQVLLASWAPKNELGIMSTVAYSGLSVGGLLGLVIPGWLSEQAGWRSIFYVEGVLICLVPPLWIILVTNYPSDHPLLSDYERRLLAENIKIKMKKNVPWKKIITSPYVIICIYCLFARIWIGVIITSKGASFLTHKIGLDLDTASYVNGTNTLLTFISSLIYGAVSDFLINKKHLSKANTRKLFHFLGSGIAPLVLLGIIFADCDQTAVIVLWILMGVFINGTAVGFTLSPIDFAPNYSAVINGLMAIGSLGGAIAPSVTSAFLKQGNGWNKIFSLSIILNFISCIVYVIFMTADPQPWNSSEEDKVSLDNNHKAKNWLKARHKTGKRFSISDISSS